MKRLTERDEFGNADIIGVDSVDLQWNLTYPQFNRVTEALNRLAAYEDAEEAGLLVRLPCKPREVVWVYYPKYKEIERIAYMTKSDILEDIEIFWAVICKTREEAEAVLKGEDADV